MNRKKVVATLTGSQMVAAYMCLRAAALGRLAEAAEMLELAMLPVPPHIAIAIWNETVAREFAKSPNAIVVVEYVVLYDDGTMEVACWNVKPAGEPEKPKTVVSRGKRPVDVNLN